MSFGSSLFGGGSYGNNTAALAGSTVEVLPPIAIPDDLIAPAPWLHFFELDPQDGSTPLRVVDWGDENVAEILTRGKVTFDGYEWDTVVLAKPQYEESTRGRLPEATLAVGDPTRAILAYVNAHGKLKDALISTRIIRYDKLDTPAKSQDRTFRVKSIQSLEGPARIQFTFGAPSLASLRFPIVKFTRTGCHNVFERRFVHDERNFCNYPSEEFDSQTEQLFALKTTGLDVETETEFGWFIIRGDTGAAAFSSSKRDLSSVNPTAVGQLGLVLDNDKDKRMWDTDLEAHFSYKKIIDDSPNSLADPLDINTRMLFLGDANTQNGQFSGIMVQSIDEPTNWIIFGANQRADGDTVLGMAVLEWRAKVRVTTNGTSVDTNTAVATIAAPAGYSYDQDNAFRITRSGSAWSFYTRAEKVNLAIDDTDTWNLQESLGASLSMTGDLRVGLINCWEGTTQSGTTQFESYFSHFRFLSGGFVRCNRTLAHCNQRNNAHQRNAYYVMPDNIVRF